MALTEEQKKKALLEYERKQKHVASSKKSGTTEPKMSKEEAKKSVQETNEKVKQNAAKEKELMAGRTDPNLYVAEKKETKPTINSAEVLSSNYVPPRQAAQQKIASSAVDRILNPTAYSKPADSTSSAPSFINPHQARSDSIARRAGVKQETLDNIQANNNYGKDIFTESTQEGMANYLSSAVGTAEIMSRLTPAGMISNAIHGRENNFWNQLNAPIQKWQEEKKADRQQAVINNGNKGAEFISQVITTATQMVPDILITIASAGTNKALTAVDKAGDVLKGAGKLKNVKSLFSAKKLLPALEKSALSTLENPSFWNSFGQTLYPEYEGALQDGATENEALLTAVLSAFAQSKIEAGSGLQKLPSEFSPTLRRAVLNYVKSAVEEGGEEIVQGVVSGITQKLIFDHDKKLLSSTSGEDAVFNMADAWGEFAMGSFMSLLMGAPGAMMSVGNAIQQPTAPVAPNAPMEINEQPPVPPAPPIAEPSVPVTEPAPTNEADNVPDPTINDELLSDDEIQANIDKLREQLVKKQPQPEQVIPQTPVEPVVPGAQGEGTRAQTNETIVTPQENRAQTNIAKDGDIALSEEKIKKEPPRKTSIEAELQSMDALGGEVGAQEGSFEGSGKKPTTQLSVKEILNSDLTEREIKRYQDRVETINAYLEGGYASLTPEQQNIYNKLGDYIPSYSKEDLIKKRDEYIKKLYGNNPPAQTTDNQSQNEKAEATNVDNGLNVILEEEVGKYQIKSINDYIGVQKTVLTKLNSENFFEGNESKRNDINKETGIAIKTNSRSIKEIFGPESRFQTLPRDLKKRKLALVDKIPYIIENGTVLDNYVPSYHEGQKNVEFTYLETPVKIDGTVYYVTLGAKHTQGGYNTWTLEVRPNSQKNSPSETTTTDAQNAERVTEVSEGTDDRIAQEAKPVKPNQENNSETEEPKTAPAAPPASPPDEPPKGPRDSDIPDVGIGARKSGENPVAQKAAQYGTYDVPKDSFTDYDDYVFRNEVSSADKKTLTESTIDYEGQTMPYSEAVVQMVMDEVKFSEQKGKYYADGTEIPKAAYDFGKNLEANGVKYWANKAEQFPTQWDDKNYVSRLVRNVASSKFGTNKTVELLEESLKNGRFIYERKHNKDTIEKAKKYITLHGVEESMKEWVNFANGNAKVSPDEILDKIALGTMLADVAFEVDDIDTATRILMDIAPWQTGMGQGIQFMSQLRKLGKDGNAPFKLTKTRAEYYVDRTLRTLNDRYAGKLENKHIELSDELRQKWISSIGTDSEYEVTQEVFGNIANQIPSSWFERFNAWRYFCMLCAPTTHTKNMTSNVAMSGATFVKDVFLSRLEANYQKKHPEYVKTASVFTNKADKDFAKGTYDEANSRYGRGGTRYSYEDSNLESMRKNTFSGADYKFLKGLRKGAGKVTDKLVNSVSGLLEKEDTMTKKGIYARKVAEIMKANGWTQEYFNSGTTQAIRDFEFAQQTAIEEAYKATFNNDNGVQKLLTSWRKMPDKTVSDRAKKYALGALVEIIFPFKKVTANIPARAIEYSPIGIAQGILELNLDSKNEDFDAHQALEHIGAGAAGSSLALAGTILGLLGVAQLTGGDENEDELKENRGWKNYSLKFGDYYFGLDDIAPVTTMLMSGVKLAQEIEELAQAYKDKDSMMEYASACVGSLLEVAAFGIDGVLQLDFFSSIKDLMTSYSNEESTRGIFEEKLEGVAESLVGQVEPNILRKIMRTIEKDYANAYYHDKNEETPSWIQNIRSGAMLLVPDKKIEQLVYKANGKEVDIPGYSELAVRYDKWGRSINPEEFVVKAANNLLSPFQISKDKSTPVDKELERLYGSTKDKSVVPQTAKKYFTQDGKRIDMTAKQYSEYQKEYGQARYKNLEKLISSEYYKKLDDKNKALAVKAAYELADDMAKDKIFEKPKDFHTNEPVARTGGYDEAIKSGLSPAAYIVSSAIYSNTQKTKTESKDERFYDYLIADKTTSAKDDVLILEHVIEKDLSKYRSVTNDHQEILDVYEATKEADKPGNGKPEGINYLTDELGGNELRAFALYSGSTASKKYENGELSGFGSKQLPKAQSLIDKKGWSGEDVAKAARCVTGLGEYLGNSRKTKANYVTVLVEAGFTKEKANEFYNYYGW